ncbi:MAG: DUF58 domain-containing protein, partial [Bacteroidales bacterium]|nr:DUF58 domain-containing protein [Bacteroidales bacterium]
MTILKVLLAVIGAVICVLPVIFLNTIYGYLPIFFYLLLLALSGTYLLILRANLTSSAEDRMLSCQRTQTEDFCLDVRNGSVLVAPKVTARITMHSESSGSGQDTVTTMALSPLENREFQFSVTFAHLGRYTVGIGDIRVSGLLGLASMKVAGGGEEKVYVTPLRHNPATLALTDLVETEDSRARASSPKDGSDYTGVREYVFGDPMKNIHWKLSAHSSSYMTKQMEILGNSGVDVVLDMVAPPWTGEDGAFMYDALVESACAVILYARERGMDCSIWFFDRSHQERNVEVG